MQLREPARVAAAYADATAVFNARFNALNDGGATILVITHDRDLAARLPRRVEMLEGEIVA